MMEKDNIRFSDILYAIELADGYQIDDILSAIHRRYRRCFPDEEIIFLSLPKNNPAERKRILDYLRNFE